MLKYDHVEQLITLSSDNMDFTVHCFQCCLNMTFWLNHKNFITVHVDTIETFSHSICKNCLQA